MVRWRGRTRSTHVEDRRGRGVGIAGGGIGILVLRVIGLCMGVDPRALLQVAEQTQPQAPAEPLQPGEDPAADFAATILGTTEEVWGDVFAERGATYEPPTMVLFTDVVRSGCGTASSQTGPFYCPLDRRVYLDLGFFHELEQLGVTVIDLSEIDDSSAGSHAKFAGSPEVVKLIGAGLQTAGRFGDVDAPGLSTLLTEVPIRLIGP